MKNSKISTIELWRFILVLAIALGHLNTFIWQGKGETLFYRWPSFSILYVFIWLFFNETL